eukprot:COSAG05_NODE_1401_length_4974_cov_74.356103_1_plen_661_part_00
MNDTNLGSPPACKAPRPVGPATASLREWLDSVSAETSPSVSAETSLTICTNCGGSRALPPEFAARCQTLVTLLEGCEAGTPVPVAALSGSEVDLLLWLDTQAARFAGVPTAFIAVACRAAGFVGHAALSESGLAALREAFSRAQSDDELDALIGAPDCVPPPLRARVEEAFNAPSVPLLVEIGAAVTSLTAESDDAGNEAVGIAQILDHDTLLALLAGLDISCCYRLGKASASVCSALFGSDGGSSPSNSWGYKSAFRAWAALLSVGTFEHSMVRLGMEQVIQTLSAEGAGMAEEAGGWSQQVVDLMVLASALNRFPSAVLADGRSPEDASVVPEWVEAQAIRLCHADPRERLVARMLVPQLAGLTYKIATARGNAQATEQLYNGFCRVVRAAAERATTVVRDALAEYRRSAGGASAHAALEVCASQQWQQCSQAHDLQRLVYMYLDIHFTSRQNRPRLADVCAEALATDGSPWEELRRDCGWVQPAAVQVVEASSADAATDGAGAGAGARSANGVAAGAVVAVRPEQIMLSSSDGEMFCVSAAVGCQLGFVRKMVDGFIATGGLPGSSGGGHVGGSASDGAGCTGALPVDVESPILAKVVEFCTWHAQAEEANVPKDTRDEWNGAFIDVDQVGAPFAVYRTHAARCERFADYLPIHSQM